MTPLGDASVLALLRLGSAALPIGAFAYSQGLEGAVASGAVHDGPSAGRWIEGMLRHALLTNDVPLLCRMHEAWSAGDRALALEHSDRLYASRGSRELRAEELALGRALSRLLSTLGHADASEFVRGRTVTLAAMYALAGRDWGAPARATALAYAFAWLEAQVGAATRLLPLGQAAAQQVLSGALLVAAGALEGALGRADADLCSTSPGQLLFSIQHERQYSRLFRS